MKTARGCNCWLNDKISDEPYQLDIARHIWQYSQARYSKIEITLSVVSYVIYPGPCPVGRDSKKYFLLMSTAIYIVLKNFEATKDLYWKFWTILGLCSLLE